MINLVAVNDKNIKHLIALYDLLAERKPWQSISHKEMPEWYDHIDFVKSHPYRDWWLISHQGNIVGATYLTKQNEIGIGVFTRYWGHGYAQAAIKEVMEKYPGQPILANINPDNEPSLNLFKKLGFKQIQVTFKHE